MLTPILYGHRIVVYPVDHDDIVREELTLGKNPLRIPPSFVLGHLEKRESVDRLREARCNDELRVLIRNLKPLRILPLIRDPKDFVLRLSEELAVHRRTFVLKVTERRRRPD